MSAFILHVETGALPMPLSSAIKELCSLCTRLGISIQTKISGYAVLVVPNDDAEKVYFVLSSAMELKSTIPLLTSSHAEWFKSHYEQQKTGDLK